MTKITFEDNKIIYTKISLIILSIMIVNAINETHGITKVRNIRGVFKDINVHDIKSIETE